MNFNEDAMRHMEEQIPELAKIATRQAYLQALASGSTVLESINDALYEVSPDGTKKLIKQLPPSTPMRIGQRIVIQ
ncbi:MAG: hypothetical protein HQL93_10965 [Magnetococcales bacterium]|nr:hypothetical protein [Magnetococcales bacterium]